jgi:hypothetical protein
VHAKAPIMEMDARPNCTVNLASTQTVLSALFKTHTKYHSRHPRLHVPALGHIGMTMTAETTTQV